MPRLSPPPREAQTEFEDIFTMAEAAMGFLPNSMRTMALKPEILQGFGGLAAVVLAPGKVASDLKSLISFVTSRSAGCHYCMAHTSHTAVHHQNVSQAKFDEIWDYERSNQVSEAERAALRVAQGAALVPNGVSDVEFDALRKHFDDEQVVEIVAVIALFGFLNRWNDTVATELEQQPKAFAEASLAEHGWEVGKHA